MIWKGGRGLTSFGDGITSNISLVTANGDPF